MLKLMRENASSLLIKILLFMIIVVFAFFGVGSRDTDKSLQVALVNGEKITIDEYRDTYDNIIEQLRQRFGENFNNDLIKMFDVKKQALERLINRRLMTQESLKLNFKISDKELANSIANMRVFQQNGIFNKEIYNRILSRNNLTPDSFEALQRESILISKLTSLITDSVKVSDKEANEWFKWQNTKVNVNYALLSPDTYKDINPSDQELQKYFETNKEKYKTDPQIKVQYLKFSSSQNQENIPVTDDEILEYYEANKDEEFYEEKTVEARHILIKVDKDADESLVEKTKLRADDIFKKAKSGQDFVKLAKKYSEGPTKDKGGYLGSFKKNAMVKPFADKAFSMQPGEISEPVKTSFGWHIIKVEKVNEAKTLSFDEAKNKIVKILTKEKSENLAYEKAEEIYDKIMDQDDLSKVAQNNKLEIFTTDFFTQKKGPNNTPNNKIGNPYLFASEAFKLNKMEVSKVNNFSDGYYIIQVTETVDPKIPELKDVNNKVKSDLIANLQDQKAKQESEAMLKSIKDDKNLNDIAKAKNLTVKETGLFKRQDSIPGIGREKNIIDAAFQLSNTKKIADNVVKGPKGYYILALKEKKSPDTLEFDNEKDKIKQNLLRQKQNKAFESWLAQIKAKSDIEIAKNFLD